ncbi:MAG TPA: biotin/lipoyl-containing protein, partial [Stellaceae bacterium]|nr:biotin/lipoyl-containing protein [Stellaceae bacterium]
MAAEIRVPTLGESITEATVARWLKQPGEAVARDEPVVELETDKVTLEVPAPQAGTIGEIRAAEGSNVPIGAVLGTIADGAAAAPHPPAAAAAGPPSPAVRERESETLSRTAGEGGARSAPGEGEGQATLDRAGPAVRKLVAESGVDVRGLVPSGPGGRLTKADVLAAPAPQPEPANEPVAPPPGQSPPPVPPPRTEPPREPPPPRPPAAPTLPAPAGGGGLGWGEERETRVRMTRLRRRIAERLKEAQQNAAMLTTFNEIDMSGAIALRERWRDAFEKKHGVRLGFMSIFVKAAIVALKELPAVNAEIDGD